MSSLIFRVETVIALLVVLTSFFVSYDRNLSWKDEVVLWRDVTSKATGGARAFNNLGSAFVNRNMFREAIEPLSLSIIIEPRHLEPHFNLANSYLKIGMMDKAALEFEEALKIVSFFDGGHYGIKVNPELRFISNANLANIYSSRGAFAEAVGHYLNALNINPSDSAVRYNLAMAYKKLGRTGDAVRELNMVLESNPDDRGARWNLMTLQGGL